MKILLLGLGRFGAEIARRLLSYGHSLIIVESDPSVVEKFLKTAKGDFKICVGDATSLLLWEYLPLEEVDLVVSSLRNAEFNKTVCEIVRGIFKLYDLPVLVLAFDRSEERFFANYNCKVLYLPEVAASFVEGYTLRNIVKPIGIGLGKNEILEVTVSPKSPYTRVPIVPHRLRHWNIALVYRGEQIILPRRRFFLRPGDRVILVGNDPRVVLEVAKAMALGEPQFPLSFGENLLVALKRRELHYLKEHYYLWKHTRVKSVVLFTDCRDKERVRKVVDDERFLSALQLEDWRGYDAVLDREVQTNHSAGLISAPHRRRFLFWSNFDLKRLFLQETPFLVPRLSFPYLRVLVSLNNENPAGMVEQVFEVFQLFRVERLTFVHVGLPEVLMPARQKKALAKALSLVEEYAKLYDAKDRVKVLLPEGNPKKVTLRMLGDYDLLVVGFERKKVGLLEPYTPYLLTKSSPKSVLGIPTERGTEVET
ncbi:MAG: hypothetical protein GXO08_05605 [Aquificae bacterium]|nr:hypothetical protein [Aquificota bacterium]